MGALSDIMGMKHARDDKKKKRGAAAQAAGGDDAGPMPEYKRGGTVKRTGPAKVHKGEEVLTAKEAKRYRARGKKR